MPQTRQAPGVALPVIVALCVQDEGPAPVCLRLAAGLNQASNSSTFRLAADLSLVLSVFLISLRRPQGSVVTLRKYQIPCGLSQRFMRLPPVRPHQVDDQTGFEAN